MRWKVKTRLEKKREKLEKLRDVKFIEFFAYFPVKIEGEVRWLERVRINGHYYIGVLTGDLLFFYSSFEEINIQQSQGVSKRFKPPSGTWLPFWGDRGREGSLQGLK